MKHLLSACTLTALVACNSVYSPQTTPVQVVPVTTQAVTGFTSEINAFRASQNRNPLQPNASLTRAAQAHAEDMARRGFFSHHSPGGPNGRSFVQRAKSGGCMLRSGAENIASGQTSESEVLAAWQASAGHRRNMLRRGYTQYGLGRSGNIWVLKLASRC